jgi:hypothetical protein
MARLRDRIVRAWVAMFFAGLSAAAIIFASGTAWDWWLLPLALLAGFLTGTVIVEEQRAERERLSPPASGPAPTSPPYGFPVELVVVILAMGLLAGRAYTGIDAVLHALHQPGDSSYGTDTLTAPFSNPFDLSTRVTTASATWLQDYLARTKDTPNLLDVQPLLTLQLSIDTLFIVPAYAMLLILLLGGARRLIQSEWQQINDTAHSSELIDTYLAASRWAVAAVLLAACADWVENGMLATLLQTSRQNGSVGLGDSLGARAFQAAAVVLGLATWLKVLGLLTVFIYLAATALLALQHGGHNSRTWVRFPQLRSTFIRLLLPAGVLVAFTALLLSNDQASDVFRRWTQGGSELGVIISGSVAPLALGVVIAVSAWWLLLAPESSSVQPANSDEASSRGWLAQQLDPLGWWFWGAGLIWYAIVWMVAWQAAGGNWPWWLAVGIVASSGVLAIGPVRTLFRSHEKSAAALAVPFILIGALALVVDWIISGVWYAAIPLLVIAAVLLLGAPLYNWPRHPPRHFTRRGSLILFMAAVPAIIAGVGVFGSGLEVALYHVWRQDGETEANLLLILGLLLGICAPILVLRVVRQIQSSLDQRFSEPVPLTPDPDRPGENTGGWRRRRKSSGFSSVLLVVGVALWMGLLGGLADMPVLFRVTSHLGLLTTLCITVGLMVTIGTGLISLVEEAFRIPPPLYRMFGAHRTSLEPIVIAWFVVTATMVPIDKTHDVRLFQTGPQMPEIPRNQALTIDQAFIDWQSRNCLLSNDSTPATADQVHQRPIVPLIVVATAGGGIRAAAWTIYVLDQTFAYGEFQACHSPRDSGAPRRMNWLFALSGVSGGSVGLETYIARQATADLDRVDGQPVPAWAEQSDQEAASGQPSRTPGHRGWVRSALGGDGLTPTLTWLLLAESQSSLLRFPLTTDSAAVLEGAFETWATAPSGDGVSALEVPSGATQGLFYMQSRAQIPLLLLNGTSVETGCRFNGSVVRTVTANGPNPTPEAPLACVMPNDLRDWRSETLGATVDLADYVCQQSDIRLSTAALLSARFPYVSPSGGLRQCLEASSTGRSAPRTFVVDGGYHEGSGMETAVDVWSVLAPQVADYNARASSPVTIVPMLLQIDNGYDEPVAPGVTPIQPQALVPPATYLATRGAVESRSRQEGQIMFSQPYGLPTALWFCGDRYAHFALRAHPGPSAPLGWVLSDVSFDDFVSQLSTMTATATATSDSDRPGDVVASWFRSDALRAKIKTDRDCDG